MKYTICDQTNLNFYLYNQYFFEKLDSAISFFLFKSGSITGDLFKGKKDVKGTWIDLKYFNENNNTFKQSLIEYFPFDDEYWKMDSSVTSSEISEPGILIMDREGYVYIDENDQIKFLQDYNETAIWARPILQLFLLSLVSRMKALINKLENKVYYSQYFNKLNKIEEKIQKTFILLDNSAFYYGYNDILKILGADIQFIYWIVRGDNINGNKYINILEIYNFISTNLIYKDEIFDFFNDLFSFEILEKSDVPLTKKEIKESKFFQWINSLETREILKERNKNYFFENEILPNEEFSRLSLNQFISSKTQGEKIISKKNQIKETYQESQEFLTQLNSLLDKNKVFFDKNKSEESDILLFIKNKTKESIFFSNLSKNTKDEKVLDKIQKDFENLNFEIKKKIQVAKNSIADLDFYEKEFQRFNKISRLKVNFDSNDNLFKDFEDEIDQLELEIKKSFDIIKRDKFLIAESRKKILSNQIDKLDSLIQQYNQLIVEKEETKEIGNQKDFDLVIKDLDQYISIIGDYPNNENTLFILKKEKESLLKNKSKITRKNFFQRWIATKPLELFQIFINFIIQYQSNQIQEIENKINLNFEFENRNDIFENFEKLKEIENKLNTDDLSNSDNLNLVIDQINEFNKQKELLEKIFKKKQDIIIDQEKLKLFLNFYENLETVYLIIDGAFDYKEDEEFKAEQVSFLALSRTDPKRFPMFQTGYLELLNQENPNFNEPKYYQLLQIENRNLLKEKILTQYDNIIIDNIIRNPFLFKVFFANKKKTLLDDQIFENYQKSNIKQVDVDDLVLINLNSYSENFQKYYFEFIEKISNLYSYAFSFRENLVTYLTDAPFWIKKIKSNKSANLIDIDQEIKTLGVNISTLWNILNKFRNIIENKNEIELKSLIENELDPRLNQKLITKSILNYQNFYFIIAVSIYLKNQVELKQDQINFILNSLFLPNKKNIIFDTNQSFDIETLSNILNFESFQTNFYRLKFSDVITFINQEQKQDISNLFFDSIIIYLRNIESLDFINLLFENKNESEKKISKFFRDALSKSKKYFFDTITALDYYLPLFYLRSDTSFIIKPLSQVLKNFFNFFREFNDLNIENQEQAAENQSMIDGVLFSNIDYIDSFDETQVNNFKKEIFEIPKKERKNIEMEIKNVIF